MVRRAGQQLLAGDRSVPRHIQKGHADPQTINQPRQADHTKETGAKAVSRSSNEEGEGAGAEVGGAEQEEARQQEREWTQAEEMQAPPQQDQEIKQAWEGHNKSIEQETHTATTTGRQIIGHTNAQISRQNSRPSYTCTSRVREKSLKNIKRDTNY